MDRKRERVDSTKWIQFLRALSYISKGDVEKALRSSREAYLIYMWRNNWRAGQREKVKKKEKRHRQGLDKLSIVLEQAFGQQGGLNSSWPGNSLSPNAWGVCLGSSVHPAVLGLPHTALLQLNTRNLHYWSLLLQWIKTWLKLNIQYDAGAWFFLVRLMSK